MRQWSATNRPTRHGDLDTALARWLTGLGVGPMSRLAVHKQRTGNMYSDVSLFIDGNWGPAAAGRTIDVVNPATGEKIGTVPHAAISDLDRALEAADKGFRTWRKVSAFDRSKVMRKAADILRQRADKIATLLTMEQGKPLAGGKRRSAGGRRRDRLVRRGSPPRLRPRDPSPRRRHLPACHQGAGRPGRRFHAMEFSDQPGRAQTVGRRWRPVARSSSRRRRRHPPPPPN